MREEWMAQMAILGTPAYFGAAWLSDHVVPVLEACAADARDHNMRAVLPKGCAALARVLAPGDLARLSVTPPPPQPTSPQARQTARPLAR